MTQKQICVPGESNQFFSDKTQTTSVQLLFRYP